MAETVLKSDRDPISTRQRLIQELLERLRRAEAVLRSLYEAEREASNQARELRRTDIMKTVTGASGIERAISTTSRMVDLLKREISEARRSVSQCETKRAEDPVSLSLVG